MKAATRKGIGPILSRISVLISGISIGISACTVWQLKHSALLSTPEPIHATGTRGDEWIPYVRTYGDGSLTGNKMPVGLGDRLVRDMEPGRSYLIRVEKNGEYSMSQVTD